LHHANVDRDLARVRAAWTELPEHVRVAIMALVDATAKR
jgi:hypothetical protein